MIRRVLFSLVFVTVTGLTACAERSQSANAGAVSFARGGQLNMVYDIRQRPQAVYLDNKVHIVFAGRKDEGLEEVEDRRVRAHRHQGGYQG